MIPFKMNKKMKNEINYYSQATRPPKFLNTSNQQGFTINTHNKLLSHIYIFRKQI